MPRRTNPIHAINAVIGWLLFLALIGGTVYFCYTLYHEYDRGYKVGFKDGTRFATYAKQEHLRALSLTRKMTEFIQGSEQNMPDKTWKEQLYRQGWETGLNDACYDLPRN